MRWQKIARFAIAVLVIAFAAVVFLAMRKRAGVPTHVEETKTTDPKAVAETGNGTLSSFKDGKVVSTVKFEHQLSYADGRSKLSGVTLTVPDRDGRIVTITSDFADVTTPPDKPKESSLGKLTGNVKLTTENGIVVTTAEATYDGSEGMLRIPGPAEFTRGRMKGTGVGATYDRNRDVLWILNQAHLSVAPEKDGTGALDATASSAGLARAENFAKLVNNAALVSDGRTAVANEITILLDEKGEKIQQLQLREQSKITGSGPGAQLMTARNIDMIYAADGRTLQSSKLMENALVELPGAAGAPSRRIVGSTIDIAMSPDGATVTNLNAQEKVQVDLPPEGELPARRIRSATLRAMGAPGQGLQNAVFEGAPVDYNETRPATAKSAAVERRARSLRLIVDTKPGLGPLERADFHGNVHFEDGEMAADAPRALYNIERDELELSPSAGDPGSGPLVTDPQLTVQARNIRVSPSTQRLKADTDVRSTIKPQQKSAAGGTTAGARGAAPNDANQTRMPAMLKADKPVTVTSNRLDYDGKSEATYVGNSLLWQDQSRISGDTIVLNNQTGNLTARTDVRTTMILQDEDPKTKVKTPTETKVSGDVLVYDDAKRLATYTATGTTPARLLSVQGDVKGDRIDLYLKESGNELDRAEADGKVTVKLEKLYATGKHSVYTAEKDEYVLTGQPVEAIQKDDQGSCKKTVGAILTYLRSIDNIRVEGMPGVARSMSEPLPACPAELRH
jgi:lipopolysaccharide export system protein LptA